MKGIKAVYVPTFSAPVTCRVLEKTDKPDGIQSYKIRITARWTKDFFNRKGYKPAYFYGDVLTVPHYDIFDSVSLWERTGKYRRNGKEWAKAFKDGKK